MFKSNSKASCLLTLLILLTLINTQNLLSQISGNFSMTLTEYCIDLRLT